MLSHEEKSPFDLEYEAQISATRARQTAIEKGRSISVGKPVVESRVGEEALKENAERDEAVLRRINELERKVTRLTATIVGLTGKVGDPLVEAKLREVVREENRLDISKLVDRCKEESGKYSRSVSEMLVKQSESLDVYLKILESDGVSEKIIEEIRKDIDMGELDVETCENIQTETRAYITKVGNPVRVREVDFIPWNIYKGEGISEYMKTVNLLGETYRPENAIDEFCKLSDTEKEAFKKADPKTYDEIEKIIKALEISSNRDAALVKIVGNSGRWITDAFDIREKNEEIAAKDQKPAKEKVVKEKAGISNPVIQEVVMGALPEEPVSDSAEGAEKKSKKVTKGSKLYGAKFKDAKKLKIEPTIEESMDADPVATAEEIAPVIEPVPNEEPKEEKKAESVIDKMNRQREEILAEGGVQFPGTEFYAKVQARLSSAGKPILDILGIRENTKTGISKLGAYKGVKIGNNFASEKDETKIKEIFGESFETIYMRLFKNGNTPK